MSDKSPSITYTEELTTDIPSSSDGIPHLCVLASQGPTETVLVYSYAAYLAAYGPASQAYEIYHTQVRQLLAASTPVAIHRVVSPSSERSNNHPDNPSPFQVVAVVMPEDFVVVEGKLGEFSVVLHYADGHSLDITSDTATQYAVDDPSYGFMENGIFFAYHKLGTVGITVRTVSGSFRSSVTVSVLQVLDIELYGPTEVTSGVVTSYRAIAHYIDDTSQDVTYLNDTTWAQVSGTYSTFTKGTLAGETVSVNAANVFSIAHKNMTKPFTVTIKPTPIKLVTAGFDVLQLVTTPVQLGATITGERYSHTFEWVWDNFGLAFDDVTSWTPTISFLPGYSLFYLVDFYIDRGTVNEQKDTIQVLLVPLSTLTNAFKSNDTEKDLESTGQFGLHVGNLDHYTGIDEFKPQASDAPILSQLPLLQNNILSLSAAAVVTSPKQQLLALQLQYYSAVGWGVHTTLTAPEDVASYEFTGLLEGWYRLKLVFSSNHLRTARGSPLDTVLSEPVLLTRSRLNLEGNSQATIGHNAGTLDGFTHTTVILSKAGLSVADTPSLLTSSFGVADGTNFAHGVPLLLSKAQLVQGQDTALLTGYRVSPNTLLSITSIILLTKN